MVKVVKKRGKEETFKPDKIRKSLAKATIDAGYSVQEKKDILDEVYSNISKKLDEKKEVKSDTIRVCLLTELDKCEPYIAKSWRNFEKKYKQR
ncbi:MAG: ATP cone domain-containing protein [Methanomicrobiales archaeon]